MRRLAVERCGPGWSFDFTTTARNRVHASIDTFERARSGEELVALGVARAMYAIRPTEAGPAAPLPIRRTHQAEVRAVPDCAPDLTIRKTPFLQTPEHPGRFQSRLTVQASGLGLPP